MSSISYHIYKGTSIRITLECNEGDFINPCECSHLWKEYKGKYLKYTSPFVVSDGHNEMTLKQEQLSDYLKKAATDFDKIIREEKEMACCPEELIAVLCVIPDFIGEFYCDESLVVRTQRIDAMTKKFINKNQADMLIKYYNYLLSEDY
jgi:hypothetical protein